MGLESTDFTQYGRPRLRDIEPMNIPREKLVRLGEGHEYEITVGNTG